MGGVRNRDARRAPVLARSTTALEVDSVDSVDSGRAVATMDRGRGLVSVTTTTAATRRRTASRDGSTRASSCRRRRPSLDDDASDRVERQGGVRRRHGRGLVEETGVDRDPGEERVQGYRDGLRLVSLALEPEAAEIIVSVGDSSDDTADIARSHGAIVVSGEKGRGNQMNAGARVATGDYILFLHATRRRRRTSWASFVDSFAIKRPSSAVSYRS